MKNEKNNYVWVFVYYIKYLWQILKRFAETFCQAQTLKLGRVSSCAVDYYYYLG